MNRGRRRKGSGRPRRQAGCARPREVSRWEA
jgi:hypothetical protein